MGENPEPTDPLLLTTAETAELARVPAATLRYWRWSGDGPDYVKLGRRVFYRRPDVLDWITKNLNRSDRP